MTTKDQEREALKKIRKIVEGLGENSYIGTAFEGCFEIAEENIENDFGCSMKQRWESEQKEAEHFREMAGKLTDELEFATKRLAEAKEKILSTADLGTIKAVLYNNQKDAQETAEQEAQEIVDHADEPSSEAFQTAVRRHRAAVSQVERYEELIQRVLNVMK